jgi:hypothetical protein
MAKQTVVAEYLAFFLWVCLTVYKGLEGNWPLLLSHWTGFSATMYHIKDG